MQTWFTKGTEESVPFWTILYFRRRQVLIKRLIIPFVSWHLLWLVLLLMMPFNLRLLELGNKVFLKAIIVSTRTIVHLIIELLSRMLFESVCTMMLPLPRVLLLLNGLFIESSSFLPLIFALVRIIRTNQSFIVILPRLLTSKLLLSSLPLRVWYERSWVLHGVVLLGLLMQYHLCRRQTLFELKICSRLDQRPVVANVQINWCHNRSIRSSVNDYVLESITILNPCCLTSWERVQRGEHSTVVLKHLFVLFEF